MRLINWALIGGVILHLLCLKCLIQNKTQPSKMIKIRYIEVDYDLSDVMFITTAQYHEYAAAFVGPDGNYSLVG